MGLDAFTLSLVKVPSSNSLGYFFFLFFSSDARLQFVNTLNCLYASPYYGIDAVRDPNRLRAYSDISISIFVYVLQIVNASRDHYWNIMLRKSIRLIPAETAVTKRSSLQSDMSPDFDAPFRPNLANNKSYGSSKPFRMSERGT